jgi:acetyltransferase-like isoleucine patch superfamily enzyme
MIKKLRNLWAIHLATLVMKLVFKLQSKKVSFHSDILFKGYPLLQLEKGTTLKIGKNVSFTSRNRGYHLNLQSPMKLMLDKKGAEIIIGDNTRIVGTCIHAQESIRIGNNCLIAGNCQIVDSSGHELSFDNVKNRIKTLGKTRPIVIHDNVWIGANTFVLPGVTIGEGSVIGAGSIVVTDIPPYSIARGNPAVVIKTYPAND